MFTYISYPLGIMPNGNPESGNPGKPEVDSDFKTAPPYSRHMGLSNGTGSGVVLRAV